MKVRDLVKALKEFDLDAEIIMQKDAEGNGYSPLCGVDTGYYVPESTWSGTFYGADYTAEDNCMDEEEFKELTSRPISLVLFPIN